jgi:hypothetical protein
MPSTTAQCSTVSLLYSCRMRSAADDERRGQSGDDHGSGYVPGAHSPMCSGHQSKALVAYLERSVNRSTLEVAQNACRSSRR